jgi:hypothetical protein
MEYIISEKQLSKISEVYYNRGGLDINENSYDSVFELLKNKKETKELIKSYLKKILGFSDKVTKDLLEDYWDFLTVNNSSIKLPKVLKSPDVLSNLAYYLASNIWGLKKVGELEVLKKITNWDIFYVFFDPTLKLSIGKIALDKVDTRDLENSVKIPKKSYKVTLSFIDKELKGSGYGKEMYFSLIEDLNMLVSDRSLSENSANIWVNILPKKYYVFAVMNDSEKGVIQIKTTKKPPKITDVTRFFAVKDPSSIKFK